MITVGGHEPMQQTLPALIGSPAARLRVDPPQPVDLGALESACRKVSA